MGANCSNVQASEDRSKVKRDTHYMEPISLKGNKDFKERYEATKGPIKGNDRLLNVRFRDTNADYVCRRIMREQVPCKDKHILTQHFQNLNGLEHPHLCKFVESFEDDDAYYLIYEKADSTTLFKWIQSGQSFAEEDAAEYTRQMCMALAVAHETGIVHGRLSPAKVVILPEDREVNEEEDDEDAPPAQVKICDMGQGFILREDPLHQLRRNASDKAQQPRQELIECMPPELAWEEVNVTSFGEFGPKIQSLDVWSLGCIAYHMLTGVPPHCAGSLDQLVERLKSTGVEFGDEWSELSSEARQAVESMLKMNPGLRPTASTMLRHPWIRMPRARLSKARLVRLLRNIRLNANEGHFKRMVMRVIAYQMPTGEREVDTIEQAFRFFDRNGDGVLGCAEICQCIRRLQLGNDSRFEDLEEIINLLDRDGSGTVNLQEFVAGALNPRLATNQLNLWYAFSAFDRDGSGTVSVDEIEAIVRNVEAGLLAKEQVDSLVSAIRNELNTITNKDVDFEQFVYIMMTPTGKQDGGLALRRDMFRTAFNLFGSDCYDVRKHKPPDWNWQQLSQSAPSAYRRTNLVVVRRKEGNFGTAGPTRSQEGGSAREDSAAASEQARSSSQRGRQPGQKGKR